VLFLLVGYRLLMIIFDFSTYHRYAAWSLPLLAVYAALAGYLLYRFRLESFFLWHIAITVALFIRTWRAAFRIGAQSLSLSLLPDGTEREFTRLSQGATKGFYWLSAILNLVIFSASFLYFYNAAFPK
jgi:hypothetical protein